MSDSDSGEEFQNKHGKRRLQRKGKDDLIKKQIFDDAAEETDEEEHDEEVLRKHRLSLKERERQDLKKSQKFKSQPDFMRSDFTEEQLKERYGQDGDDNEIDDLEEEQDMNISEDLDMIPAKNQPKIFSTEVFNRGSEYELVVQLLNKFKYLQDKDQNFKIFSVTTSQTQPGLLFIEAFKKQDVTYAINGLQGIKFNTVKLVQDIDIPKVFAIKEEEEYNIKNGQFCLIKSGCSMPYSEDLVWVTSIEHNNICEIKVLERPDLNKDNDVGSKKRKGGTYQEMDDDDLEDDNQPRKFNRFFQAKPKFTMQNRPQKTTNVINKKISIKNLETDFDLTNYKQDLIDLTESPDFGTCYENYKRNISISQTFRSRYQVCDKIQVTAGDYAGVKGKIVKIGTETVTINPLLKGLTKENWEIPIKEIKKFFKSGQHVKVIGGQYMNYTGQISYIDKDTNLADVITDNGNNIQVKCDDLVKSEQRHLQIDSNLSGLKRFDLIKLIDQSGVGIVLSISVDYLTILDESNTVRNISKIQYDQKIDTRRFTTKTVRHDVIESGSMVTIIDGQYKGLKALVKHVFKDICFLFSEDFNSQQENIIVEKNNNLLLSSSNIVEKRSQAIFNDRQKVEKIQKVQEKEVQPNNAIGQQKPVRKEENSVNLVGTSLVIQRGQYKGLNGIVKNVSGDTVRIEIPTKMKTVTIKKSDINEKSGEQNQQKTPSYNPQSVHHSQVQNMQSPFYNKNQQSPVYSMQSPHHQRANNF